MKRFVQRCVKVPPTLDDVDTAVEGRCSMLMEQVGPLLAKRERREMVRAKLKKTEVTPKKAAAVVRQTEFAEMEEFRGIPPTVTYENAGAEVEYIPYFNTTEIERAAALRLLADSIAEDQQTYLAMKSGNEFASTLVTLYGDLPLWDLYGRWKKDQKRKERGA